MKEKRVHNIKSLKSTRKKLRSSLTPSEAFLWNHLKNKQLEGRRFVKQHSIGKFVVDFYCATEKLIIELDGEVHMNPTTNLYDDQRTDYFNRLGYHVLRFENKMVFDNLDSVLFEIKANFNSI